VQALELTILVGTLWLDSGASLFAVEQQITIGKPNITLPAQRTDDELVRHPVAMGAVLVVDAEDGIALVAPVLRERSYPCLYSAERGDRSRPAA
jgi:hypothetical protein